VLAIEPTLAQSLASRVAEAIALGSGTARASLRTNASSASVAALCESAAAYGVISHSEVPAQLRVASVAVLE